MFGTQNLPLFVASGLLLNLMPGPDTLYIVGRSVSQGRKAGVVSVLGISSGCAVHTVAAAFGLSAILAASASAFTVVRLAGAAYLVYLGLRLWLERAAVARPAGALPAQRLWPIYRQCSSSTRQSTAPRSPGSPPRSAPGCGRAHPAVPWSSGPPVRCSSAWA